MFTDAAENVKDQQHLAYELEERQRLRWLKKHLLLSWPSAAALVMKEGRVVK